MDFKQRLDLNSYEWWRNHRKLLTYGGFLLFFGIYISPLVRQASYKNKCIDYVVEANLIEAEKQQITIFQNVSIEKWAHINAYRQCNNTSANK